MNQELKGSMVEIVSVAGIIGLSIVGIAVIMALIGRDVPAWLTMAVGTVVGYFYGKGRNGGNSG